MMNKKRIYAGLISAILLAALTGCGANAEQNTPAAPVDTAQVTTTDANAEPVDCCGGEGETKECCKDKDADCCEKETSDAASGELEKTTFEIGHLNSTAHLLVFVAKEEGFFEEEGLSANLTLFSSAGELATGR